jgi:pseudouridine-5'-phosphate glycosidase
MARPAKNHLEFLEVREPVQAALAAGQPVVALESTVIAHGLPWPANIEVAQAMEEAIRVEGATPATVALLDGRIVIGLDTRDIERLVTPRDVLKASRRDLAPALVHKATAATTVAGTLACAALAGIRVFATGGIGGVHRNATQTLDISSDLTELSRVPIITVCAGAKAILDLPLTLEYLETQSVPVIGYGTSELPAFFVRTSGLAVPHRADTPDEVAAIAKMQWRMGHPGGVLVTCPIPEEHALNPQVAEQAITAALHEAQEQRVYGAALTPFLLARVAELTGGESVSANQALLLHNVRIAARIANSLATRNSGTIRV